MAMEKLPNIVRLGRWQIMIMVILPLCPEHIVSASSSPAPPLVVCQLEECKKLAWAELVRQRPTAKVTEYAFLGLSYIHDPTQPLKRDYVRVSYQKLEPVGSDSETIGEITTITRRFEVLEIELGLTGSVLKTGSRIERRTDIQQVQPTPAPSPMPNRAPALP